MSRLPGAIQLGADAVAAQEQSSSPPRVPLGARQCAHSLPQGLLGQGSAGGNSCSAASPSAQPTAAREGGGNTAEPSGLQPASPSSCTRASVAKELRGCD